MDDAELRKPKPQPAPLRAADITVIGDNDVVLPRKFTSDRGRIRTQEQSGKQERPRSCSAAVLRIWLRLRDGIGSGLR